MPERWDPTELIGTKAGSCLLERLIGRGGASAVFLARQTRPQRNVAVKVLHPRLAPDSGSWDVFLARFRREADAAAALDHANIVPVYAYGDEGDMAYLVMPYLPDGSLGDLVRLDGPRSLSTTIAYVEQAAAALDYAHRAGILHRDVKLTNLLVHPDGRVMLTDFGIARPLDTTRIAAPAASDTLSGIGNTSLTQAGGLVGTPEYMAPEQIRGGKLGPTVDVYALATVTWALLGGHTPFGGGDTAEVLSRQIKAPPPPLRTLRPDVPPAVEEIIFAGLAKEATDRPPTPSAFAQALRGAAERAGARVGRGSVAGIALASRGGPPPASDDTMMDGPPGGVPLWPMHEPTPEGPRDPRRRGWMWPLLSLALAVLLIGATCVATANWLTQLGVAGPRGIVDRIPSPTATVTPTPSPTPNPDSWLVASTQSIELSCIPLLNRARISLRNEGPESVGWSVSQHGGGSLSESPSHGTLDPGEVVTVTVTVTRAKGPQSGELRFSPSDGQAGPPVVVTYTIGACGG